MSSSEEESDLSESIKSNQLEDEEVLFNEAIKRQKRAREYLEEIATDGIDAEQLDKELLGARVKKDAGVKQGKFIEAMADKMYLDEHIARRLTKLGRVPTAVVSSHDSVYVAERGNQIRKVSVKGSVRTNLVLPRRTNILCAAIHSRWLASGHADGSVAIWSIENDKMMFCSERLHRASVLSLAFAFNPSDDPPVVTLFSSSADRSIKLCQLNEETGELTLLDTLYGHKDAIPSLAVTTSELCVSAGGRDTTILGWNLIEEAQLVFRPNAPMNEEHVSMLDAETWVSASSPLDHPNEAMLSLWIRRKKKPIAYVDALSPVTALLAMPFSDQIFTGHMDGCIRRWRASVQERSLTLLQQIDQMLPKSCFVNAMTLSEDQDDPQNYTGLIVAFGREPRLGRWVVSQGVTNSVHLVPLRSRKLENSFVSQ